MTAYGPALQNLVSALGGRDQSLPGSPYVLGDDGLGCLRDLKRWLKFYDDSRDLWDIKAALATMNIVTTDLCPILAGWSIQDADDEIQRRICQACVEILVPMTWPLELDEHSSQTKREQAPNLRLAQTSYKRAILFNAEHDILGSIMRVAFPSLALERRQRTDKDTGIIRLVLYLLRNLAAIDSAHHRSETILAFQRGYAFDFLNVLASGMGSDFNDEDVIVIDVMFHLLRGVQPPSIFSVDAASTPQAISADLNSLLSQEKHLQRNSKVKAHTRHNRFGTMVSVVKDKRRFTVASQTALVTSQDLSNFQGIESNKRWNRSARKLKSEDDIELKISLNIEARVVLASFATAFLEAGFNPLFATLLKGLENEHLRVAPEHRVQFLYLQSWFLQALRISASLKQTDTSNEDFAEDADYALIASMMETRAQVMLRKMMREALDLKVYKEAQAAFECLKQMLLTIHAMSMSSDSSFQEIADNLLANIFYEEGSLDQIVAAVKGYTNQSLGYLNAITELASILLKMLEKYCSEKTHFYVRGRRRRQRQRQGKQRPAGDVSHGESSGEDGAKAAVTERAFNFARFEAKFNNDHAVDTFLALLEHYVDLSADQIKRCIHFLHRVFVKQKNELLLFRIDLIELLHRMLCDNGGVQPKAARDEVQAFCTYFMKRFAKQVEEAPALGWELLFNKLDTNPFYLTHDVDRPPAEKKEARVPAQLELKGATSQKEGIRVCVAILMQEDEQFVKWLHDELKNVLGEREAWRARHAAIHAASDDVPEVVFTAAFLRGTDEIGEILHKNNKARLLMELVGCEADEDSRRSFLLAADRELDQLRQHVELLQSYLRSPPTIETDETAMTFFRRKVKKSSYNTDGSSSDDDSASQAEREPVKKQRAKVPRRRRVKTTGAEDDDGEVSEGSRKKGDERREKREAAERDRNAQVKSAKYVLDSDDEDEADMAAFFAREETLRKQRQLKEPTLLSQPSQVTAQPRRPATEQALAAKFYDDEGSEKENRVASQKLFMSSDVSDDEMDRQPPGTAMPLVGSKRATDQDKVSEFRNKKARMLVLAESDEE